MLWLSILVLVPFDISSVDTSIANGTSADANEPPPLVTRILDISKEYLSSSGPMQTIVVLLFSMLLTCPDMLPALSRFNFLQKIHNATINFLLSVYVIFLAVLISFHQILSLFSFIEWTHEVLSSATEDIMHHFKLLGTVESLAAIFKVCFLSQFMLSCTIICSLYIFTVCWTFIFMISMYISVG